MVIKLESEKAISKSMKINIDSIANSLPACLQNDLYLAIIFPVKWSRLDREGAVKMWYI